MPNLGTPPDKKPPKEKQAVPSEEKKDKS